MRATSHKFFILGILMAVLLPLLVGATPTAEELRSQIDARSKNIKALETEITTYKKELDTTGKQINTLSGAVKELTTTSKKLKVDINLTEVRIDTSKLKIEELSHDIGNKEDSLGRSRDALSSIVRSNEERQNLSAAETFITQNSMSELWVDLDMLATLSEGLQEHIAEVRTIKSELESAKTAKEKEQQSLKKYKEDLGGQREVAEYNRKTTNELLSQTKNKESNYKKILSDREARKRAFESELAALESQLKIVLDLSQLPETGKKALAWPVLTPFITQEFGDTAFSRQNPGVYNGRGHNGIDLRANIGDPIMASEAGTIVGVGDTDLACPGASYGRWVLIEHGNGLTTLYAHLSVIRASARQIIARGETIGYAGKTGYSTGPHLHFTVYASQGVQVRSLPSKGCLGRTYTLPVAPYASYLNPLLYL